MAGAVLTTTPQKGTTLATWSGLSGSENGDAISVARWSDKTVQASGTFTTITVQGSNDGSTWHTLHDLQGNDLVIATPGIEVIAENPLLVRVAAVGAAGCVATIFGRDVS